MARKSIVELVADIASLIPDNTTEAIEPADIRFVLLELLATFRPAYGSLSIPTVPHAIVVGLTPTLLTFTAAQDSSPETVSAFATGSIARAERGASRITFSADMELGANRECTITLFKNGVATPWSIKGSGSGTGRPAAVSMVILDYADPAATYTFMCTADAAATTVTFTNVSAILEVLPVNTY
jgi:hypothetical protein